MTVMAVGTEDGVAKGKDGEGRTCKSWWLMGRVGKEAFMLLNATLMLGPVLGNQAQSSRGARAIHTCYHCTNEHDRRRYQGHWHRAEKKPLKERLCRAVGLENTSQRRTFLPES